MQTPVLPIAYTRFRYAWKWDGSEVVLQSRCTDEHGDTQPALEALVKARGENWNYHYNAIQSWKVTKEGSVENTLG